MPAFDEIRAEIIARFRKGDKSAFDSVRRKYLEELAAHAGCNVILYASCFTQKQQVPFELTTIVEEDMQGFMGAIYRLDKKKDLDLILHSPGGQMEAAEGIADYVHAHFPKRQFRVVVPQMAMSAATMIACAADAVVMGKHSCLGPIDPQFYLQTPLGVRPCPAQAIIDQFYRGLRESNDRDKRAWRAMLRYYAPSLIQECDNEIKKSKDFTKELLIRRMFKNVKPARNQKMHANRVVKYLGDHNNFRTHSKHISRDTARKEKLVVENLEADQKYQDLVLSIFHATTMTFSATPAAKIIENHSGRAFIKLHIPAGNRP